MTISPPYLKDKDNNTLSFPPKFYVRSESISRRSSLVQLPFSNLSKETSDGCFNPRRIDVTGIIYAADETEALTLLDAIHAFSNKRGLELWYKGRRIKIDKLLESSLQDTGKKGFLYNVSISYQAGDPFWYGEEIEEVFNLGGMYGHEHSIEVGGTADTFPVITLMMADSGDYISLNINGMQCGLSYSLAVDDVVVIDCYNGTVKVNGENAIAYFSGVFPRLLGGQNNSIQYTGPDCLVSIKYSEAYI